MFSDRHLGLPTWFTKLFSHRERAVAAFDEFDRTVDQLINIRAREPKNNPEDLLARLVAARDVETGGGITAKEVRDEVVTIFMAGHETTAQALTWTWYLLSLHPSIEASSTSLEFGKMSHLASNSLVTAVMIGA